MRILFIRPRYKSLSSGQFDLSGTASRHPGYKTETVLSIRTREEGNKNRHCRVASFHCTCRRDAICKSALIYSHPHFRRHVVDENWNSTSRDVTPPSNARTEFQRASSLRREMRSLTLSFSQSDKLNSAKRYNHCALRFEMYRVFANSKRVDVYAKCAQDERNFPNTINKLNCDRSWKQIANQRVYPGLWDLSSYIYLRFKSLTLIYMSTNREYDL